MLSASRVAARFLRGTFQAPRTIVRDRSEAEDLVNRLTPIEREILTHLFNHGTVAADAGSRILLGPPIKKRDPRPRDYKKVPHGLMVVRDLERTKWLRKTPTDGHWELTREGEAVLKLVLHRQAAADFSKILDQATQYDLIEVNEAYIFDIESIRKAGRKTVIRGVDASGQRFELTYSKGGVLKFEEDGELVELAVEQVRIV